jgi:hypothetical protein
MTDPKHAPIREVPPKTPIIDAIEGLGKGGKVVGGVLRALRRPFLMRRQAKQQEYIDKHHHDKLRHGQPERDDVP